MGISLLLFHFQGLEELAVEENVRQVSLDDFVPTFPVLWTRLQQYRASLPSTALRVRPGALFRRLLHRNRLGIKTLSFFGAFKSVKTISLNPLPRPEEEEEDEWETDDDDDGVEGEAVAQPE